MFRSKAVAVWRDADASTRLAAVAAYQHYTGPWSEPQALALRPGAVGQDPLFVVQAEKPA